LRGREAGLQEVVAAEQQEIKNAKKVNVATNRWQLSLLSGCGNLMDGIELSRKKSKGGEFGYSKSDAEK